MTKLNFPLRMGLCGIALGILGACDDFDFDLRGNAGAFSTSQAALNATADRPKPDNRGVISYPNYQVVVAQRGDTLGSVAERIGMNADQLGDYNGIAPDAPLRQGEIIALPSRVAEPSPATGAIGTGPIRPDSVDVTALAGQAIEKAENPADPVQKTTPKSPRKKQSGEEPIRHKVKRGETAYSISRRYKVPVKALARWNGLDSQYTIRVGQFLLIPVTNAPLPQPDTDTAPGQGSPTPTPPSADRPLPDEKVAPASKDKPADVAADVGKKTDKSAGGLFSYPVQGTIIREYVKGRNEGINIKAKPGAPVRSAASGTVAAITESGDGVPIIVVRHKDNLLTVYANVTDVQVQKGEQVNRGQTLAKLREGDESFVHFEVRKGFDSVDPNEFLN